MNSSGGSVTTRLPIPSGTEQTAARSCGDFHMSSGTDCMEATQSSSLAFMGDETHRWLVADFARAPNAQLQRTHLRQGYGGQARAASSALSFKALGNPRMLSWRQSSPTPLFRLP
jgi:hypothetical protein